MRIFYSLLGLLAILFLLLPSALGENGYLTLIDNLDSEFVYLDVLKRSGLLFSTTPDAPVDQIMNGLPRNYFHSEFNFVRIIFLTLPSLYAYILNGFLVRVIGFCGSYVLLRDQVMTEKKQYAPFLAFIFACMPLYTLYGVSVAGLPWLMWAFLKLKNNSKNWIAWIPLFAYPFYAHFAMVGPFVIGLLGCYGLYIFFSERSIPTGFWLGLIALTSFFILSEINLIATFFNNQTVSHRADWDLPYHSLGEVISESIKIFIRGHYHAGSFFFVPAYILIFSVMISNYRNGQSNKILIIMLGLVALFSIIYPAYPYFRSQVKDVLPILMSFQFSRFIFLIPLLWLVGLAIAVDQCRWSQGIIGGLLIVQIALSGWSNNELKMNLVHTVGINTSGLYFDQPSFKQFFEPALFEEVDAYIHKPKSDYRVVSVGLHPAVAQYNGFYTLDSYQNNYPLFYKNEFRGIISSELDKDPALKIFYDDWGSRCYVFSAEIWKKYKVSFEKMGKSDLAIEALDIHVEAIRSLGGEFIFSAQPINNYQGLGLIMEKKFSQDGSAFDIYLYRIPELN